MKKRFMAVLLALVLCMGLAVLPAAAEMTFNGNWITFSNYVITNEYESYGQYCDKNPDWTAHVYGDNDYYYYGLGEILGQDYLYCFLLPADATVTFNSPEYCIWGIKLKEVASEGNLKEWEPAGQTEKSFSADQDGTQWDLARFQKEFADFDYLFCGPGSDPWAGEDITPISFMFVDEPSTQPTAPTFTDVPSWCASSVAWAAQNGITDGVGNNRFAPGNPCTHEQILTFLYRAARDGGTASAGDMAAAVNWAREKGMVDASFDPKASCTRADAVAYIWQAFGKEDAPASGFVDVSAGADYTAAVNWAVDSGIVEGYPDGGFHPDTVCNRGVIVTMLYRAYVPEVRLK